jgi:predicted nucleic acid-binding protein
MSVFVDTNVLVYFRDSTEPDKQARAGRWLERLWRERTGRLSFQVLSEFYVVVTAKLSPGLDPEQARADVRALMAWEPVAVGRRALEAAWTVQKGCRLSWWDALIVAAARLQGCRHLLTEDLAAGQDLDGVTVVNPFVAAPEEVLG